MSDNDTVKLFWEVTTFEAFVITSVLFAYL